MVRQVLTDLYAIRYENKRRRQHKWFPWLLPLIAVANIAVFLVVMYVNNCPHDMEFTGGACFAAFLNRFSFQPLKENPLLGPSSSTLLKMGALQWNKVVYDRQIWRLVSSMWLHAGVIHLAANMVCLICIGIHLEELFGFVRIGIIYLVSGFGGSVLSTLFTGDGVSGGASGALFGLLGAMLSELLTNWTIYTYKAAAFSSLVVVIVVNLSLGLLPQVSYFTHIGGFISGLLLGFVLLVRPQFGWQERAIIPGRDVATKYRKYRAYQYVLGLFALCLLIVGLTVGVVMVCHGVNGYNHCYWCRYLHNKMRFTSGLETMQSVSQ